MEEKREGGYSFFSEEVEPQERGRRVSF